MLPKILLQPGKNQLFPPIIYILLRLLFELVTYSKSAPNFIVLLRFLYLVS